MMKSTLRKGTAIALSGMMILSGMSLVYADSQTAAKNTVSSQTRTATAKWQHDFKGHMGDFKTGNFKMGDFKGQHTNPMDALIKAGTITQTQADAIKTALEAGRESKTTFADVLKNLVTAGTLTQEQADAITKAMPAPPTGGMKGQLQNRVNPMDALIKAGTLTQTQADAIKTALEAGRESKTTFADVLKNLVTAGTLTQDQSDAITKAMPAPPTGGMKGQLQNRVNPMDALIKAGTITQTQADAIKTALDAGRESKTTFADVLKNLVTAGTLTQEQADAITKAMPAHPVGDMDQNHHNRVNPMTALVTAGTITQTQADAVQAALKAGHDNKTAFADVFKTLVTNGTLTQDQADALTAAMTPPSQK